MNSREPDQMPLFGYLVLNCLSMSIKKDARLIWVNILPIILLLFIKIILIHFSQNGLVICLFAHFPSYNTFVICTTMNFYFILISEKNTELPTHLLDCESGDGKQIIFNGWLSL